MRSIRTLPIRQKVSVIIMLTTACALVLACGAFILFDYVSLRQSTARNLDTLGVVVASRSAAALMFNDTEAATEILASVHADPSIVRGAIYTAAGRRFVTYGTIRNAPVRNIDAVYTHRGLVETFEPIRYRNEVVGMLYLAEDFREVHRGLRLKIVASAVVLLLALGVALIMTARLQRLVTRPLIELAEAAHHVSREKDFAVRVASRDDDSDDALGAVVHAFNEMLEEIGQRDEALRLYQLELERQVAARTADLTTAVEHNRAILDSAGEGIFGLDAKGVVTFINPVAARVLGCDVFAVIGRKLHPGVHASVSRDASKPLADCRVCSPLLGTSERSGRDTFFRGSDAAEVPIEFTANAIVGDDGSAGGVVVTFRDISERLVIEQIKDEFVSTVSHELRTPLTAIRGALGLLSGGLLGEPTPKGQRMLEVALANTERLGRLINDILDLEKMESGFVELNRDHIYADDLLCVALEAMQPVADRTGVKLVATGDRAELFVDADRIMQMLVNLLSNAIKFSAPNTTVTVTGRADDDRYVVSVRDEGRGIPEDKLETIFERFRQVDASDSRDKGGTGLGLAICRSIAEAHGGTIWAERAKPAGSIFTFELPIHQYQEVANAR